MNVALVYGRVAAMLARSSVLLTFLGGCADKVILYPHLGPEDPRGAQRRVIPFEGGELEVWVARSPAAAGRAPQAYMLGFVGNAARAEWSASGHAAWWGEHPVEVWEVNYPGYGGSTAPAQLKRLAPAGLAAFDALAKQAGGRPIFVSGVSLGTTVALYVAAHRPAAGMILRNPPPLRQLLRGQYGWWNLWLGAGAIAASVPGELDSLANAPGVRAPAIFLLAEDDEVVPPPYQRSVVAAYAGAKRIISLAGARHNSPLSETSQNGLAAALEWLWDRRVRSAPEP